MENKFTPLAAPLSPAEAMPLKDQDTVRSIVPATTVNYQDGHMLLSREGVLHLAEEVIAGRTVGNVAAAHEMKAEILRSYPSL